MPEDIPTPGGGLLDKLAGRAKQALGNLSGNDDLAEEGSLQTQRAEAGVEAARLEAEAAQAEREAELAADQESNRVRQAEIGAEMADQARSEQIEQEERAAKVEVAQVDAHQHEVAAAQDRTADAVLERKAVDAVADRIGGAQEAAEMDAEARQAEAVADALNAAQKNLDQKTIGG